MKGITSAVVLVLLSVITILAMGIAYLFITGIIGTASGKAIYTSGGGSCLNGVATISFRNVGSQVISNTLDDNEFLVKLKSCGPSCSLTVGEFLDITGNSGDVKPGDYGSFTVDCETQNECIYDVIVGGIAYPVKSDCLNTF